MSSTPESTLRDLLADRLDLVEDGLSFLNKEKYVPSELGTRGFIDILAKDSRGRWVLIELKRSGAAARQAVHEIYKYVEGVKAHLRARDDEIRALIISTEWDELLVPFSRFVDDTSISVSGIRLTVDDKRQVLISTEKIEPLPIHSGRVLSPWHEIYFYKSEERLKDGLKSCNDSCSVKGVTDYIMVEMEAPEGFYEASVVATARSLSAESHEPSEEQIADLASKMDRLEIMVYLVPLLLTEDDYAAIVARNPDNYSEVIEYIEGMEGDELLETYQSGILHAAPRIANDRFEIGYPAKFRCRLLQDEGWRIRKVHRRGAFARNTVLTDEVILSEISGDAGTTGQRLKRSILLSEKGEVSQLKRDIEESLSNNPVWQASIISQIDEAMADFPNGKIEVTIFTPTTGVMTLFNALREDGVLFIPTYSIIVFDVEVAKRGYFGEIASENDRKINADTFNSVIEKYYDGEIGSLLLTTTWGGYESRDLDILEDLGLFYTSFRCEMDGDSREFFKMLNGRWRRADKIAPFGGLQAYADANPKIFRVIDAKLSPRVNGGMWDGSSAIRQLEELVDDETMGNSKYHIDAPESCDICGVSLADEVFFSDGRIKGVGHWANMCADCTVYHGAGIGWGSGQLYKNNGSNEWLLVAGASPHDQDDESDET
jgi:Endonuclease NucS